MANMVIGTNSKHSIFEVFHTGVKEVIRNAGIPEKMSLTAKDASMDARSADFSKKIDMLKFKFQVKEGTQRETLEAELAKTKIPYQLTLDGGTCTLSMPPFQWDQLNRLAPVDKVCEAHSKDTLRSRSWLVDVKRYIRFEFNINVLIEHMMKTKASDIHLRAGMPPFLRVDSDLSAMTDIPALSADDMREVVLQLGGQVEVDKLDTEKENSFQYHLAGIGYLRCSGYIKMGSMALAIRFIPEAPFPFASLDLPPFLEKVALMHRGLFLVCGVTGSGKSTTLSSMVDHLNASVRRHIITIEDPIEFVYSDKKSIISQRQVGRDTHSFADALRGALREDPDTILVGEMRDRETIRAGLSAASTGHMVFSTLHTTTAVDTVNRIISYFPQAERDVIRQELAYSLIGVCCQRLLRRAAGGRIPCIELLIANLPMVADAILEGNIEMLTNIIEVDTDMQSFEQGALALFRAGKITREEALSACRDEESFERQVSGIKGTEGRRLLK